MKNAIISFFCGLAGAAAFFAMQTAYSKYRDSAHTTVDNPLSICSGFSGFTPNHSKTGGAYQAGTSSTSIKICCRGMDDGKDGTLFWREFRLTPDGRIASILPESDAMGVYTDQGPAKPRNCEKIIPTSAPAPRTKLNLLNRPKKGQPHAAQPKD